MSTSRRQLLCPKTSKMSKLMNPGPLPPNAANNNIITAAANNKHNANNQMTSPLNAGGLPQRSSNQNGNPHIMNNPQQQQQRRTMDTTSTNHTNIMASPMNGNGKVPHSLKRQAPNDSVDKPTPMKNSNGSSQKMNGGNKRSAEPMSGKPQNAFFFHIAKS